MTRVRLLDPQDIAAEQRALAAGLDAQGAFINIYRAMAHSPRALRGFVDLASSLWGGVLGARVREIAILSVASASDAAYPLGWHILDAQDAGLTASEVRAIVSGDIIAIPRPDEAAVALFARELTVNARVSDATFQGIAAFMNAQQIVELTMVVGLYRLVACVTNGLRVDLDDEPARALEQLRAL